MLTISDLSRNEQLSGASMGKVAGGSDLTNAAGAAAEALGNNLYALGCPVAWFDCYETAQALYKAP